MTETLTSPHLTEVPDTPSRQAEDRHEELARELIGRHFVMQHARPPELQEVALADIDPQLRTLLFSDGTVTRVLEIGVLRRVSVNVVAERPSEIPAGLHACFDVPSGTEASLRRVTIRADGDPVPLVYAESVIVHSRLPTGFSAQLRSSRQGIGEALRVGRWGSQRELLWFGLGSAPEWAGPSDASRPVLARVYRVLIAGKVAMVISESFAIEDRAVVASGS